MAPKQPELSRRNHYVPAWYQRGFVLGPRITLHYLDLDPLVIVSRGRSRKVGKELAPRTPRRCFWKKDLYSTRFGRNWNDEVERRLFGAIDTTGAAAARAFVNNDQRGIHENFQEFFEYLNAQKLRTPKGLDWIRSSYPELSQVELMEEMQHLRQMHCTMWIEGVREIVSAENSDVKFIVTDHPVTVYNPACAPTASACRYPNDPPTSLIGTQTVFALDANHCLILTNLEYAENPNGVDPVSRRQNARYAARTLARTDAWIRSRTLTPDDVTTINHLLKVRSRKYLAGYEEAWLFPEKAGSIAWEDIAKVLLPPTDELWQFGGETYIGYEDGSTEYLDAFGRKDQLHEFTKKKDVPTDLAPHDPCGCGSGRMYRKCCRGVASEDRQPWNVYSIRDRNLALCNAVIDILGLNGEKSWEAARRELSDDQVKRIHEVVEMLWPRDTDLADLLPRPDQRVFRAVYMGLTDPRTIQTSVISSLAYFDEIFVMHPFTNPAYIAPKFSPTQLPASHKPQLVKNVVVLLLLQPFIDAGIVHLVPDPVEFNADFRDSFMAAIERRAKNWKLQEEELEVGKDLFRDDLFRLMMRLPEDRMKRELQKANPDVGSEVLSRAYELAKKAFADDPISLIQPFPGKVEGGEVQLLRGVSLEFAMFVAQLAGAAIYTDQSPWWRQLQQYANAAPSTGAPSPWMALSDQMASLSLEFEANPLINLETRCAGKLARVRRVFRQIWKAVQTQGNGAEVKKTAMQLAANLESASQRAATEWKTCVTAMDQSGRFRQRIECCIPSSGFKLNSVNRHLLTSGRTNYIGSVPIAFSFENEAAEDVTSASQQT